MSKNIQFQLFLIFLPLIGSLVMDREMAQKDLPEYSEYLRQQGLLTIAKSTTAVAEVPAAEKFQQPPPLDTPFGPFTQFPIHLFKDLKPLTDNIYDNIYYWLMLVMIVLGMVIYYLRSYLWFKEKFAARNKPKEENQSASIYSSTNGRTPDYQNFDGKSADEAYISRLLPLRPVAIPVDSEVSDSNGGKFRSTAV